MFLMSIFFLGGDIQLAIIWVNLGRTIFFFLISMAMRRAEENNSHTKLKNLKN